MIKASAKKTAPADVVRSVKPNKVDARRVDRGDFVRVSGLTICVRCTYAYFDHPRVPAFEWLTRACDGRLLKL